MMMWRSLLRSTVVKGSGRVGRFVGRPRKFLGTTPSRFLSALPAVTNASPSPKGAEEAVNNILYNVPLFKEKTKSHVLSVLVDNEVGILSKISGLLSARGFNIDSLTVSKTDVKELSRMTIKVFGKKAQVVQCRRQLEDLVNIWAVVDYTDVSHLDRELVLVKVSTTGGLPNKDAVSEPLPSANNASMDDKMMSNHFRRSAVLELAKMYDAKVADIGTDHVIVELVSWSRRCDAFVRMMQPFGVLECVRSGTSTSVFETSLLFIVT